MSIVDGTRSHLRLFGPYGVYVVAKSRLLRQSAEIAVAHGRSRHPIHLRLRTTDVSLFEEVLVNGEYDFDWNCSPTAIVDAGANIGLTSIHFANRYPGARVIAVEPEDGNFEMLVKNTSRYPNIVPVKAALWNRDGPVNLSDPGSGAWGFRTNDSAKGPLTTTVRGITMQTLMQEHALSRVDLLKVDIEGSESEVFSASTPWIDQVGILIVELHDRWKPGCGDSVRAATASRFPVEVTRGETTFFFREPPAASRLGRQTVAASAVGRARIVRVSRHVGA